MIVRRFNEEGIQRFQSFLEDARQNPRQPLPQALLENDRLATAVVPHLQVELRPLATRGDAANYLAGILEPLHDTDIVADAGLWTWLTLFYFDEVCPLKDGRRVVRNDYHYIFEPKNSRHFYRHLLFVSWRVLRISRGYARLFLGTPLSVLDKVTTEVMKRLFLTRIPCIFEVLDRLYWDEERGRARPGIVGTKPAKPGDLMHRLPVRIRQLEKTYDLFVLDADRMIDLLGDEFRRLAFPRQEAAVSTTEVAPSAEDSRPSAKARQTEEILTLSQLRPWMIKSFPPGTHVAWLSGPGSSDILEIGKQGPLVGSTNRMGRNLVTWTSIESAYGHLLSKGWVTPDVLDRDGVVICSLLAGLPCIELVQDKGMVTLRRK